jgi:hypothetical protein
VSEETRMPGHATVNAPAVASVPEHKCASKKVEVSVNGLPGLTPKGLARLGGRLQTFTDELAREASLIEEGERGERGADLDSPEVTATMIDEAYRVVRRPRVLANPPPPASPIKKPIKIGQAVSGVVTGAMLTLMHSYWQVAVCAAVGMAFFISTIWLIWGQHE